MRTSTSMTRVGGFRKVNHQIQYLYENGGRSIRINFFLILVASAVLCTPAFGQTSTTILDTWNKGVVDNNPTCSPSFTISEPQMITYIDTYHWNSGQGTSSGGTISLKKDDGKIFGPWTVKAESGSGVPNVWWISQPNVVIPAGTYTIIDSESMTWSMNSESNNCGFSKVEGHPEKDLSGQEITPGSITKKPETPITAPSNGGSFKITNIEYLNEIMANGARGDLTVYWSGDPVFPVKMVYRPRSCSPGVTCTTPTMTFDVRQNPLAFPESVWCTGSEGIYFDYEVVIIDARGIESAPYPAPFTCKGSTDLSGQENGPDSIAKKPESSITTPSNGGSTKASTTSTSGLKDSLAGDWIMQGIQTGVENSDFKAVLILNADGTLNWRQTEGANVGATRSGTWEYSGSTITLKWSSPKGGQITWTSTSVSTDEISEGTYTAEQVTGGTWSAVRSSAQVSGLKESIQSSSLLGDWMMEGKQTGVENSDFKAVLTLDSDGNLKWNQTEGANVGTLRYGTWKFDGNILTLKWSSPKGGQITWISSSVTGDEIADGTYTAEHVSGGTWAASRSIQSGTEKEAAIYQEKHLGDDNKKNPSSFTPNQGDFLKAVKDDLRKIGSEASKKTLEHLSKYISEGRVTFSNEKEDKVGDASVDGNSPPNKLIINQEPVNNWYQFNSVSEKAQQKNDLGKEKEYSINKKMSSMGMAFALIHEDVHMVQKYPDQTPEFENLAYETQISEERNFINENMQKIRDIQARGSNLPGDQDKLNELITDLTVSCNEYQLNTQNMESEVIAKGYVDRDRFKTAVADMEKLVKEGRDLIKSVNQNVSDPCSGMAEPIRHLVGCD